jgi:hypothetical protein
MNRREMFRILPLSLLGLPSLAKAAAEPEKPATEPSPWVETDCTRERWDDANEKVIWRCGTRFKFIRGAHAICPNCGALQSLYWSNGGRDKIAGIEVKT